MEELPSAPAPKLDDGYGGGGDSRFGRRDDSFRQDRPGFAREDLPLPTRPPYTAFIGNLAFDVVEDDVAAHFGEMKLNSVKIIKDRDDKPKGFGYVEFQSLDDLKTAISMSGTSLTGRTIRVSVAEPPKSGFGGAEDDEKFDNPWRRDGPLPDREPQRRFDGDRGDRGDRGPPPPSVSEGINDWRAMGKPRASIPEPDTSSYRRRPSNFVSDGNADHEDQWSKGSKFKPSEDAGSRFGGMRSRGDMPPPREDEGAWRSARPARTFSAGPGSPNDSTPPTPQMGRRKLELLPRSGQVSSAPSPLASPKLGGSQPTSRSNPFGAAKPIDVTQREKEVEERIARDREALHNRAPLSRTTSRTGTDRGANSPEPTTPASPKARPAVAPAALRPAFSFANAAAKKDEA